MIYGNKLSKYINIDDMIRLSITEDFKVLEENYCSDSYYILESKIGDLIGGAITAIKTAINKFGRLIKQWFTTAIQKISKKLSKYKDFKNNFKKWITEKIEDAKRKKEYKEYTKPKYSQKDMNTAIANASNEEREQFLKNYKLYGFNTQEDTKKKVKDAVDDIYRNPESYGLTRYKDFYDVSHKYDLEQDIEINIFNADDFLSSIKFDKFDINIDLIFDQGEITGSREIYQTLGKNNKDSIVSYGIGFIDDIKNSIEKAKEMVITMYPDAVWLCVDSNDFLFTKKRSNHYNFTENTNGNVYREEYRRLCIEAPDIENKDKYIEFWKTINIKSLEDLLKTDLITTIDSTNIDGYKKDFDTLRKNEEKKLNDLSNQLDNLQKDLKKNNSDIVDVKYKETYYSYDSDEGIESMKTKQIPKQPFLDYISAIKNIIMDLLTTLNSMNSSYLLAVDKCIQTDYDQMKTIINLIK